MSSPTSTPPTTVNVNLPRRGSSLGIGSIVLGSLAFIVCWIPLLGIVGIPLSGLGLLLGILGVLIALVRRGSSIGLPLAGSIVSAVALTVALVFTTAIVSGAKGVARAIDETNKRNNATNQEPSAPAAVTPAPTPTTLALVAPAPTDSPQPTSPGSTSPATTPSAVTPAPAAPAAKPESAAPPAQPEETWAPADTPVKQGDIQIRVMSAVVGKVPLIETFGGGNSTSEDDLLTITIELTNISTTHKLDYATWAGDGLTLQRNFATLKDNFGNTYKRNRFSSAKPVGRTVSASIYPNKNISDVLVFEPPLDTAEHLDLEMPASNFGGTGMIRLRIPKTMIKSTAPAQAGDNAATPKPADSAK